MINNCAESDFFSVKGFSIGSHPVTPQSYIACATVAERYFCICHYVAFTVLATVDFNYSFCVLRQSVSRIQRNEDSAKKEIGHLGKQTWSSTGALNYS
jgi:hypothetical protein